MFYKRFEILILCIIVVVLPMLALTACNDIKDDGIVVLDNGTVISAYCSENGIGTTSTVFPGVRFASRRTINNLKLVSYNVKSVEGVSCHNVQFEVSDKLSNMKFDEYNIYSCVFKPVVTLSGNVVKYEKLLIDSFEVEIDGEKVVLNQKYYLAIFEGENNIVDNMTGSLVSDKADLLTAELKARDNINIKRVYFVDDAISLENGIRNGDRIPVDSLLALCPDRLSENESFTFSFSCKLKNNILSGSGYFIVEYSLDDDNTIYKCPFGLVFLNYDWQKVAKSLLT